MMEDLNKICEEQRTSWNSLFKYQVIGNKWDPWNVLRVPFTWYNHYKNLGGLWLKDSFLKEHLNNILKCPEYCETIEILEYRKYLKSIGG